VTNVVWFFERNTQVLVLEITYCPESLEYVLEIRRSDVAPQTERFTDGAVFRARLSALERTLSDQQWRPHSPPITVPEGWPEPAAQAQVFIERQRDRTAVLKRPSTLEGEGERDDTRRRR
jgi:hypothetical protein